MGRKNAIAMLHDTLHILEKGCYKVNGKKVHLKLTEDQMTSARVFLPEDVKRVSEFTDFEHARRLGRCSYSCENEDSFSLARKRMFKLSYLYGVDTKRPVLVLNLANPVNPGGGVRTGAKAQEEDLCRKSSLLLSLEGIHAAPYYEYNRSLDTFMGSDAVIIHPQVEIIKDENGDLLDETVVVSVMTCAAPMITYGLEGMTEAQYEAMVYKRIMGMLKVAAYMGYKYLVLGAFGCGAFDNDAHVVSDLFYKALKDFDYDGMKENDMFRRIDFAVLDRTRDQYNYKEFCRNFSDFYRKEDQQVTDETLKKIRETEVHLDAIRGCIFGGAVGDALGYPVEFMRTSEIVAKYGLPGITDLELDPDTGVALISDDTQMSLFTANGLLVGDTRGSMRGIQGPPRGYVAEAYLDWYRTQTSTMKKVNHLEADSRTKGSSWLLDVPELYDRRAPGTTCLSALGDPYYSPDFLEAKRNNSKGCGGIMRVAPLAVNYNMNVEYLDLEGAQLAAITHGHSLGYMPAAVLVHIINRIVFPPPGISMSLKEIVLEARDTITRLFLDDPNLPELIAIIDLAVELAEKEEEGKADGEDLVNIHKIGEGWVAEETLAIAIYCSLKYQNDFRAGVIAAVNHSGDSDSTGAVTGNILGALLGYKAIPNSWKKNLELADVILEISDDLCHGCHMTEFSHYVDNDWVEKYMHMRRPAKKHVKKPEKIFFWNDNEKNGQFSNWYRCKFVIDDFEYMHVEQYMMAQKAKLFHDSARYTAILRATTPEDCKALGRQVTPFDRSTWDDIKFDIVKAGNRAKFEQNPELKQALMDTGDAILAEASPKDKVWGIGLDAENAENTDMEQWPGENLLGKVLMELRSDFVEEEGN